MDKKALKEAIEEVLAEKELGKFTKKTGWSLGAGVKVTSSWIPETPMPHGKEKAVLHELLKKYPPLHNDCAAQLGSGISNVNSAIKGEKLDDAFEGFLWAMEDTKGNFDSSWEHHKRAHLDIGYLTKMKNELIGYVHLSFKFSPKGLTYNLSATFSKEKPEYAEELFEKRFKDDIHNGNYIKLKIK